MASTPLQMLKTKLGAGARPNRYRVSLSAKVGPTDDVLIDTLCKGSSIPAKTIGTIEVFNQGRKLLLAGDVEFENTWELNFWDTEDHSIRRAFDTWLTYIDDIENHKRSWDKNADYTTEKAKVEQLSTKDNSVKATYEFRNMFPTSIASIEVADESNNTVEEFSVTMTYSHWIRID